MIIFFLPLLIKLPYAAHKVTGTPGEMDLLSILLMSQAVLILRIWVLFQKIRHSILDKIGLEIFLLKTSKREIKQIRFRSSNISNSLKHKIHLFWLDLLEHFQTVK